MKAELHRCLGLLILGIAIFAADGITMASDAGWYHDYREAVAVAKREGKPVLADFSTSWCGNCRELESKTFPHPAVASRLESFVKVHVDAEENPRLAQEF